MGRRKKKKEHPYDLENMTDYDQRVGSLVNQGVSVTVNNKNQRETVRESIAN